MEACAAGSVDWSACYPALCDPSTGQLPHPVDFADVGCGFGGLLIKLGENYPDEISVGIEIREKVSSYVDARIKALRAENEGKCVPAQVASPKQEAATQA